MAWLVYLLAIAIPVVVAWRNIGNRQLWFAMSLGALLFTLGGWTVFSQVAALDVGSVPDRISPNTTVREPGAASRADCTGKPNDPCGTPPETTEKPAASPRRQPQPSFWLGLSFAACVGFLLAGILRGGPAAAPEVSPLPTPTGLPATISAPRLPADLVIDERTAGNVRILDLAGRLTLGEGCAAFREHVLGLLAAGNAHILVNLNGVNRVDSAGIGVLVEALIQTAKEGGRLKLLHLPRLVHNTLVVHRLLTAFEIWDDEARAVASFQS